MLCGGSGVFLGVSGWGMERELKTTKLCIQHSKVFILNIPYTTLQKILSYSNTTLHPPQNTELDINVVYTQAVLVNFPALHKVILFLSTLSLGKHKHHNGGQ